MKWVDEIAARFDTPGDLDTPRKSIAIVLLTALILSLHILFYRPFFQTIDDVFVAMVNAGVGFCKDPSEFNMYTHFLLGLVLKALYLAFPSLPHFGIFLTVVNSVSIITIIYLATLRLSMTRAVAVMIFLTAVVFHSWLAQMTYTHTAFLAGAAGLSLTAVWLHGSLSRTLQAAQFVMILLSLLIRAESFILALLCYLPVFFLLAIRSSQRKSALLRFAVILLTTFSAYLLLKSSNNSYYTNSSNAYGYQYWKNVYQPVIDYGRIDLRKPAEIEKHGLTTDDVNLFKTWYSGDTALFGYDRMVSLLADQSNYRVGLTLKNAAGVIVRRALKIDHLILLGIVGLNLILLSAEYRIYSLLSLICSLALCGFIVIWMKLPERVSLPIFAAQVIISQILLVFEKRNPTRLKYGIVALCGGALFLFSVFHNHNTYCQREEKYLQNKNLVSQLPIMPSNLFVSWGPTLFDIGPFDDMQDLKGLRLVHIGPPFHMSYSGQMLSEFGIADLGFAMNTFRNIFIAQTDEDRSIYRKYVKKRYGQELATELRFSNAYFKWYALPPNQ